MQLSVHSANFPFYRDFLAFLGWRTIEEDDITYAAVDNNNSSLWFHATDISVTNNYDSVGGMNHLAIHTEAQADVGTVAAWLTERGIALLFGTPQHRAEFTWDDGQTYYQVMFETPDKLLIEVVYIGPRQP